MGERYLELEELSWVAIHGRGVIHTGAASLCARVLAQAGLTSGRESYYYMRYDDSPERDHIPMIWYVVIGNPSVEIVLPEEVEPIGELFNAILVFDSSMLIHKTSQRALLFDGAKRDAVLVVNTSLKPSQILDLVKKYCLAQDWFGRLVTVRARSYDRNIAFGLIGALVKAFRDLKISHVIDALNVLGFKDKVDIVRKAYDDAEPIDVKVYAEEAVTRKATSKPQQASRGWWDINMYREYQRRAAEALTYTMRVNAMPSWEVLAPGLIEFGPLPGERNIGFTTSFSRYMRPVIDTSKCIDCKLCSVYCPDGAVDYGEIKVDYEYCQGCGICASICPVKAVTMIHELKALEDMDETEVTTVGEALMEYGY